jgi:hypothetical protein
MHTIIVIILHAQVYQYFGLLNDYIDVVFCLEINFEIGVLNNWSENMSFYMDHLHVRNKTTRIHVKINILIIIIDENKKQRT